MLTRLVREHNQKQQAVRRNNEQLRKEVLQSVGEVTDCLAENLNERHVRIISLLDKHSCSKKKVIGVASIFKTQREIESEARRLSAQSAKYTKQTKQWLNMLDGFNSALKELGDVQNWAEVIEKDMREIAMVLEFVHKGTMDGESIDITKQ
ncbi:2703_t:CDS:2 [Acaulospora morrowiae]|uniref:Biogenesis of lysosome-related organelles complex 1 subunit 1 n=1 Tax=Acaulospora morrowiae TaxID=94023 RepID=A0A9N9H724_9GLOM|nr:2703_t:CDS:2 [Acaulospora morrowiae]